MQPYDLTTHDGKTVDALTDAALKECERRLGYPLTIVQGSYHKGVGASAGTHDGGGVVDLAPFDAANKVRVLRAVGFAAWHRLPLPGVWGEHIHAVLIGNAKLSPSAARQVTSYRNGRNGLANNGPDDAPRPNPLPLFVWPAPKPAARPTGPTNLSRLHERYRADKVIDLNLLDAAAKNGRIGTKAAAAAIRVIVNRLPIR